MGANVAEHPTFEILCCHPLIGSMDCDMLLTKAVEQFVFKLWLSLGSGGLNACFQFIHSQGCSRLTAGQGTANVGENLSARLSHDLPFRECHWRMKERPAGVGKSRLSVQPPAKGMCSSAPRRRPRQCISHSGKPINP